jgi:hypothetical protein
MTDSTLKAPSAQPVQPAPWSAVVSAMDTCWDLWAGPKRTNDQTTLDAAWDHYEHTSRAYHQGAGEDCSCRKTS